VMFQVEIFWVVMRVELW